MRFREVFATDADDLDFIWKSQLWAGIALILLGLAIALFPNLLEVLVAVAIIIGGIGVIGSGLRMRRLQKRRHEFSTFDTFEW
jgi:uncharacterized membrane protein HdeD (DUF308 family)